MVSWTDLAKVGVTYFAFIGSVVFVTWLAYR